MCELIAEQLRGFGGANRTKYAAVSTCNQRQITRWKSARWNMVITHSKVKYTGRSEDKTSRNLSFPSNFVETLVLSHMTEHPCLIYLFNPIHPAQNKRHNTETALQSQSDTPANTVGYKMTPIIYLLDKLPLSWTLQNVSLYSSQSRLHHLVSWRQSPLMDLTSSIV